MGLCDYESVINSIKLPYNNGLAEGKVSKLNWTFLNIWDIYSKKFLEGIAKWSNTFRWTAVLADRSSKSLSLKKHVRINTFYSSTLDLFYIHALLLYAYEG